MLMVFIIAVGLIAIGDTNFMLGDAKTNNQTDW
jgi:hypothetical protein